MASIVYEMETLQVFRENSVVTVTINQPAKKNAINAQMWDGLAEIFREIASRADDRVVVVTGAGDDFCSGADLSGRGGSSAASSGAVSSVGAQNQVHHLAAMRRVDACHFSRQFRCAMPYHRDHLGRHPNKTLHRRQ